MDLDLSKIEEFSPQSQDEMQQIPPHLRGLKLPELLTIFPKTVSVYKFGAADHFELKNFVKDYISTHPDTTNDWGNNLSTWFNTNNESFLNIDEPIVQKFKSFLSTSFETLVKIYQWKMSTDHTISECWINKATEGGFQKRHSHSNCWVSGAYYLDFKENSSPIRFWDNIGESNHPYFCSEFDELNPLNAPWTDINPREGDLLLWQSNLLHETLPEKSDERISISMNFVPNEISAGPYSIKLSK